MVDSPQDNNGDFDSIEAELDAYKREHARLMRRIRELYEENRDLKQNDCSSVDGHARGFSSLESRVAPELGSSGHGTKTGLDGGSDQKSGNQAPPAETIVHVISNEAQTVHFNHPRLGIRCACPECSPGPGNSPKVQAAALEVLKELREMPPEEFRKALDEQMAFQMTDDEVRASISSHYKRDPDCTVKGDMWDAAFHDGVEFLRPRKEQLESALKTAVNWLGRFDSSCPVHIVERLMRISDNE